MIQTTRPSPHDSPEFNSRCTPRRRWPTRSREDPNLSRPRSSIGCGPPRPGRPAAPTAYKSPATPRHAEARRATGPPDVSERRVLCGDPIDRCAGYSVRQRGLIPTDLRRQLLDGQLPNPAPGRVRTTRSPTPVPSVPAVRPGGRNTLSRTQYPPVSVRPCPGQPRTPREPTTHRGRFSRSIYRPNGTVMRCGRTVVTAVELVEQLPEPAARRADVVLAHSLSDAGLERRASLVDASSDLCWPPGRPGGRPVVA